MAFTPTYRLATVVVAPVNSGYTADYYTDGTADNVEIQGAINALPAGGGRIVLTEGTYNIADKILINKSNVTIEGAGSATLLKAIVSLNKDMFLISLPGGTANINNITMKSMKLDGRNASQTSGHILNTYGMKLGSFEDLGFYNAFDYAINLDGTNQGLVDSYWNRVSKCVFDNANKGGWIRSVNSHENLFYSNIMVGNGPGKYGIDIQIGWDLLFGNKFGGGFGATASTPALVSLAGSIPTRLIANQFNGSLRELLRVTGDGMVIESNQFSNPSVNSLGVYPYIYVNSEKNLINQNIFVSDVTTALLDIQEDTGAGFNLISNNQLDKGVLGNGISTIVKDNISNTALSPDGRYSGTTESGTAGAALAFGDLCYFNNNDSRWELVDANLSDGYDKKLGICVLAAAADGSPTTMLLNGKVRANTAFPSFTIGSPVYMGEVAGDVVVAQPSTANVCIRVVGFGNTADELYFNPSNDSVIHL